MSRCAVFQFRCDAAISNGVRPCASRPFGSTCSIRQRSIRDARSIVTARTRSEGVIEMCVPGSGAIAVAQRSIKITIPHWLRLLDARICKIRSRTIYAVSSSLTGVGSNCERTFAQAGIGRVQLNIACSLLSKFQPMRLSILITCAAMSTSFAAQPEAAPTSTVPTAAAEVGKDVVHQLNNAFAKVFEIVAPSVVIIEISRKNEGSESSAFEDLFFQGPPDENNRRQNPHGSQPVQSEGSGFIVRPDGHIF